MLRRYPRTNLRREMDQLQREMNRLFDPTLQGRLFHSPSYPAINLWTNEDGQVISAEMPGVRMEDIDISLTADALSLSGTRYPDEVAREAHYHRQERSYGSFSRTLQLPFMVDPDRVEANFKNGVLTIWLPRAEADKPRSITIKAGK
jgi:HSP20 family protein